MKKQTSHQQEKKLSRREFLGGTAAAAMAFTIVPRHVLGGVGYTPPSDKLNIAGIGVGSQGRGDVDIFGSENIVALCDVDQDYLFVREAFKAYPKAKKYTDFRRMLEKQKDIDAVVVATPDHNHAIVSMTAIQLGKHVYCEKPLTHSVYEARKLAEAAREAKVATQMGNQGQASERVRVICEMIWDGAIGPVREVHVWTDRPVWAQGVDRPKETPPAPSKLNWDLWLGPAPYRPYHRVYVRSIWRGWWDFGTGALGDIAAHDFPQIINVLKLGYPTSVEACGSTFARRPPFDSPEVDSTPEMNKDTYPRASIVRYTFPARGDMQPVKLTWYDGGLKPARPEELDEEREMGNDGILYVGDKGKMLNGRLIPESRMKAYKQPPKTLPRSIGHHKEWIEACKGGKPAGSNFDVSGPATETVLLGNIALRTGKQLKWDGPNMKVTNVPEADQYTHRQYRQGWTL